MGSTRPAARPTARRRPTPLCLVVAVASLAAATSAASGEDAAPDRSRSAEGDASRASELGVRPGRVFEPLQAGVRWPRFSASLQFVSGGVVERAGVTNMGGTLPLFGGQFRGSAASAAAPENQAPDGPIWEAGLHAGIFAVFDMDLPSQPLTNADYLIGPYFALRQGRWSGMVRLYHQSSHLGDEFLLSNPNFTRIDIHWELIEILASYDVRDWLRIYGGGGSLVRRSPNIGVGQARIGIEARGERPLFWRIRPVGALDLSWLARGRWRTNVSLQFGLEMSPSWWPRVRFQWMAEYYGGSIPDGQFLRQRTDRYGSGFHIFF